MERRNTNEVMIGGGGGRGGRQSDLLKSFRLAVRPLLTCCSHEDFTKEFSRFNGLEQQSLRHLFIQVITSLHKMIEEEFESLCIETQWQLRDVWQVCGFGQMYGPQDGTLKVLPSSSLRKRLLDFANCFLVLANELRHLSCGVYVADNFLCCLQIATSILQAATTLDTVEQLVEEQSLDPLFSDRTNVLDVARDLSMAKEKEIHHLMGILERAEEHNRLVGARIEVLKKGRRDFSGTADTIEKLRRVIVDYGAQ